MRRQRFTTAFLMLLAVLAAAWPARAQIIVTPAPYLSSAGVALGGIAVPDFFRLSTVNTAVPAAGDCNDAAETGRHYFDSTNDKYYVCSGASGWVQIAGVGMAGTYWTRTGTVLSPTTPGDTVSVAGLTVTGATAFQGAVTFPYIAKTAAYVATAADYVIHCTANSFTVTLPTAVGIAGRTYIVKNSGTATTITLDGDGAETIDGAASQALIGGVSLTVQSTGTAWIIL